jgi:hypothetical protein
MVSRLIPPGICGATLSHSTDSPFTAFGLDFPQDKIYNGLSDPTVAPDQFSDHISQWLSGYYQHSNFASRTLEGIDAISKRGTLRTATVECWSTEEKQRYFELDAALRADTGAVPYPDIQPALFKNADKALFDTSVAEELLPNVDSVFVSSTSGVWICVYGFFAVEKRYNDLVAGGKKVRPMGFLELPGANHFVCNLLFIQILYQLSVRRHTAIKVKLLPERLRKPCRCRYDSNFKCTYKPIFNALHAYI